MTEQDYHSRQWYHPEYKEDQRLPPGMNLEQTMLLMVTVSILGPLVLIAVVEFLIRCARVKHGQPDSHGGNVDAELAAAKSQEAGENNNGKIVKY